MTQDDDFDGWDEDLEMPTDRPCVCCGVNPAEGWAQIDDDWYCHGDGDITCFMLGVQEGAWHRRR